MPVKPFTFLSFNAVAVGMAAVGASLLSASAAAANGDASVGIRGSLGVSLGDLSLDTGGGTWAFVINAGFAVAFCVAACSMARGKSGDSGPPRGKIFSAERLLPSFG
jgi:hypothetical protein